MSPVVRDTKKGRCIMMDVMTVLVWKEDSLHAQKRLVVSVRPEFDGVARFFHDLEGWSRLRLAVPGCGRRVSDTRDREINK